MPRRNKVPMSKKSKVGFIALGTLAGGSLVAGSAIAVLTNIEPNNQNNNPGNGGVTNVSFNTAAFKSEIDEKYSDIVEFNMQYPVKDCSTVSFIADEEKLTIMGESTLNIQNYPVVYTVTEFTSSSYSEFFGSTYTTFIEKVNSNSASQDDADAFLLYCSELINEENVVSFSEVEYLNDANTNKLTKSIINSFINTDIEITEEQKNIMKASLVTNEIKLIESHYSQRGYDYSSRKFKYEYIAQFNYCGYQFYVNGEFKTSAEIKSKEQFTTILLSEYQKNPEQFKVSAKYNNAFAEIFNKAEKDDVQNIPEHEEELEM